MRLCVFADSLFVHRFILVRLGPRDGQACTSRA
jgi:hypothetical protein